MVKSLDLRNLAISHYEKGKKAPEIAKLLENQVHRSTIHRWLTQYKRVGPVKIKKNPGRPRYEQRKKLVKLVKKRLNSKNTRKSLRTMAQDFKSNTRTIKRALNEDLNKKCYKKIRVQRLKKEQKQKRKSCCAWIRKNITRKKLEKMMFTDEIFFTKNGYFNTKNDVIWANSRIEANKAGGRHEKEKFPVSIMVALGATWNGLTVPYFFEKGERLNSNTYTEKLLPFYEKQGNPLFKNKDWSFQQDGASSHTGSKAQK